MTTAVNNVKRELKLKVTIKGMKVDSRDNKCVKDGQCYHVTEHSEFKSAGMKKRSPEGCLVSPKKKVQRMDRIVKLQCLNLLKELMRHPSGWIFGEPVDPVKWNIPDYFSVIKRPMDLGTVKNKLERYLYSSVDQFASDVRLTFSNAMLYNPSVDDVHKIAKFLNCTFEKKWKSLEAKLKGERASGVKYDDQDLAQSVEKSCVDDKKEGVNRGPIRVNFGISDKHMSTEGRQNVQMSFEEKLKLKSEVIEALNGKMTTKLSAVFKKFGLAGLQVKRLQSYIDATDDEILWKLKKEIKISIETKAGKANSVKTVKVGSRFSGKNDLKAKCTLCGTRTCHCWEKNAPCQAFSSDLSSVEHNHSGDSRLDGESKYSSTLESRSGPESDGCGVVSSGSPHLSTPSTTAVSGEGWTTCDIQLSPKRALRAAMLKIRFASTIYKANHQVDKSDPTTMQQERERLERQQLEEKARIEKEIKATEAALQKKVQDELKMKREKEREAARMALRKMERSVEIYESQEIWRDLERLCCSPDAVRNPLENLGLRMKDDCCDYFEEDDAIMFGVEEGEIIS